MIEHRGYIGTIEVDADDNRLFGKIVNIDGGLMYEGDTVDELKANMAAVVDSYLELCKEDNAAPLKPFSGKFALRVDPRTHARLAAIAEESGRSINTVIVDAIDRELAAHTTAVDDAAAAVRSALDAHLARYREAIEARFPTIEWRTPGITKPQVAFVSSIDTSRIADIMNEQLESCVQILDKHIPKVEPSLGELAKGILWQHHGEVKLDVHPMSRRKK